MDDVRQRDRETIGILQEAVGEIQQLRRVNELLEAKVSTMNLFAVALGMKSGAEALRPDPLWRLEKYLAKLQQVEKVTQRLSPRPMDPEDMAGNTTGQVGSLRPVGLNTVQAQSDINREPPDAVPDPGDYPF